MSIEEIINVLTNERACVARQSGTGCDRDCFRCDLVLPDKVILQVYDAAVALLKTHPEAQPNEPLTLEELRKMDGQPVWVKAPGVSNDISGRWVIVEGVDLEDRTIYTRGDFSCHDYGAVWLAYRRPPKED